MGERYTCDQPIPPFCLGSYEKSPERCESLPFQCRALILNLRRLLSARRGITSILPARSSYLLQNNTFADLSWSERADPTFSGASACPEPHHTVRHTLERCKASARQPHPSSERPAPVKPKRSSKVARALADSPNGNAPREAPTRQQWA